VGAWRPLWPATLQYRRGIDDFIAASRGVAKLPLGNATREPADDSEATLGRVFKRFARRMAQSAAKG
jgi:hypothetical protein